MTSSIDAGSTGNDATRITNTKCPKSIDGKHLWLRYGQWPSVWGECKHCAVTWYSK